MDSPPSDLVHRSKAYPNRSLKNVATWAVTLIASAIFIAAAVPMLGGYGFFEERFQQWGYPDWFQMTVGIIEVISAIFLIIPTTAFYASLALAAIMAGAIYTHLVLGQAALAIVPVVMLGLLAFIGWMRRPRRLRTHTPRVRGE